ncbi:hypothetical protein ACX03_16140 [Vibrio parahaemolyticus]|uniref:hypothetical protein n=1 Tax=Vibrio diabolicus TaxID=50719 RepID=UPI0006B2969B|nr:hypothetical protein [Vibrio diabolicus]KOY44554.1 hypothetical protein ACX03_16140 [Vibrio parahaemolyticus]MCQ9248213.1 hypothetical protein [Vibrio diabolicus]
MEDIFGRYAVMAFGAMFAAIVAGFFAFMSLIASKEQKVSEFRQEWINSLRDSIASYISSLAYLSVLYKHHNDLTGEKKNKYEMARDVEDIYAKVNESYNDIIFRINDDEKDPEGKKLNDDFLAALSETRSKYNEAKLTDARLACDDLREKTKPLLKFEWKRVKEGEKNYRLAKRISVIILCIGILLSGVNLYIIWSVSSNSFEPKAKVEHVNPEKVIQQSNQPQA